MDLLDLVPIPKYHPGEARLSALKSRVAAQGNAKEALAKYDEALKYAPSWKQLRDAHETAAKQRT